MANSDSDVVAQLMLELARVQQSSTANRLSERNCVELVAQLVEREYIEVIHTCDGRDYVHPKQLERDIRDELIVQKGV